MRVAVAAGAAALLCAACITVDVKTPGKPLDPALLRTRVDTRQFAADLVDRVALAADGIAARAPKQRLDTLRWKIGASSASRQAAYRDEPQLALVDTWAFAAQMAQFFDAGAGRDLFGTEHAAALEAAQGVARDAESLASRLLSPDALAAYRGVVVAYAAAEPLRDLAFDRAPIAARWREAADRHGTRMETSGTAAEVAADAAQRLERLRVPDEVRWRADLAVAESGLQSEDVKQAMQRFQSEFANLNELARTQPAAAMARLESLQAEFARTAARFDKRWAETLAALEVERVATMRDLKSMQAELDVTIERERKALVAAADAQRAALAGDAGRLGRELLPLAAAELRRVIGEILLLLVPVLLVLLGLPFAAGYLTGRARTRRPTA